MKELVYVILATMCLCTVSSFAEDRITPRKVHGANEIWRLIQQLSPRPERIIGGELEQDNLNDLQVKEIVRITQNIYPGAIVTIDGVQDSCPCEDGPKCTAQVWVVLEQVDETSGLMLSKIENKWVIGPVQQWWLDSDLITRQLMAFENEAVPYSEDTQRKINTLLNKRVELWKNHPKCNDIKDSTH